VLLIDARRRPSGRLGPRKAPIQVSDLRGFSRTHLPENSSRFIHAKMIVATIGRTDHVLTERELHDAALGDAQKPSTNAEACLYRSFRRASFRCSGIDALLKAGGRSSWATSRRCGSTNGCS